MNGTRHPRMRIQLDPLSNHFSEIILQKELSHAINPSWLSPLWKGAALSPFDVLCREVLNMPRYLKFLGTHVIKNDPKRKNNSEKMAILLSGSSSACTGSLSKGSKFIALASICG